MGQPVNLLEDTSSNQTQPVNLLADTNTPTTTESSNNTVKLFPDITDAMIIQHPILSAIGQTAQTAGVPAYHLLNQLLNNAPRSMLNRAGIEPPSSDNPIVNDVAKVGGVLGMIESPINKAIMGASNLTGLQKSMAIGASYSPTNVQQGDLMDQTISDLKQRLNQSVLGGFLSKVPDVVNAGKSMVDKMNSSYISNNIVPKVEKMYNDAVSQWTPGIQKLVSDVKGNLKVPDSVINYINDSKNNNIISRGPQQIEQTAAALNNSPSSVHNMLTSGMNGKLTEAQQAYENTIGKADVFIPMTKTWKATNSYLVNKGIIDNLGNETNAAKQILKIDPEASHVYGTYQLMKTANGVGSTIAQRSNVAPISPQMWMQSRDYLNSGQAPKVLLDAMHQDAQKVGINVQPARELYSQYMQMKDRLGSLLSPSGENTIGNIFNQPSDVHETLDAASKYLGTNITRYAKDVSTANILSKVRQAPFQQTLLGDSTIGKALEDVSHISKSGQAKVVQSRLEDILGKSSDLNKVFNDLRFKRYQGVVATGAGGVLAATAYGVLHGLSDKAKNAIIPEDNLNTQYNGN